MKAKEVIETLTRCYDLDDELFITWWDKSSAEDVSGAKISRQFWEYIVDTLDNDEWFVSGINDTIAQIIRDGEEI